MLPNFFTTIERLWQSKAFRFLIFGGIAAVFNVLLLVAIIKIFKVETPFLRNLANVVSIEISLIFSFFLYRAWVWPTKGSRTWKETFGQMPVYHLSVAASITSRSFIIFPILDWLGVHHVINTLFGILVGSIVNYKISNRWVFNS